MRKDELHQAARWINLIVGFLNIYLFSLGGGYSLLGIGIINISVWVFTRRVNK
tara:strand:+ start:415 stop:573 length:159 start_codon:yes stop_codon:yes gene_type:complete